MNKEYDWTLKDANFTKDRGKVFSCFSCGGGSTMGYKLAGFDVIGCNEIDHKMMEIYKANHNPKYSYLEPIQTFKNREDLPQELYELDILDGSPPCSLFSTANTKREDMWGKEKKFREGQQLQVLDTLFFDFIDLAKKLQPKMVISENVKGLTLDVAKEYLNKIHQELDKAGYYTCQVLLNAKTMGVPQSRTRVFFISIRKDLSAQFMSGLFSDVFSISMNFNEAEIPYKEIEQLDGNESAKSIPAGFVEYWKQIKPGQTISDVHPKGTGFQACKLNPNISLPTIRAASNDYYHYEQERKLYDDEIIMASSFPRDYNFLKQKPIYVCGMSVPPLMVKKIAEQVYLQVLSKI